ncbi:MAG TPA: cell division protein ZapA [Chitinophagales bacterium]|nr:cell division protein ZapA [Chitinophagales bacterium]HNL84730.1 cell division protein ZapA [Chitinophagales bacterium]
MAEHLNINLLIAGRPYKLKVAQDEEGYVRQAAKEINDKIADYQKTLLTRDRQDFLSMIALQATTDVLQNKNKATNANIDTKLDELEIILDKALGLTLF